MKRSMIIKKVTAVILAVLIVVVSMVPGSSSTTRVFAEEISTGISSGIEAGDHISICTACPEGYTGASYWRVLDREADGSLFLMSEYLWKGNGDDPDALLQFNPEAFEIEWQGSAAQAWCKGFERSILRGIDGLEILETTRSDEAYQSPDFEMVKFQARENILNKDKVFFLSAEEAVHYMPTTAARCTDLPEGMRDRETPSWWLRSPRDIEQATCAGRVFSNGEVFKNEVYQHSAARPAFRARLTSDADISRFEGEQGTVWFLQQHQFGKKSYNWSSGNKTCTAKTTCSHCGYEAKEAARISSRITKAATANATGTRTYTAVFKNTVFAAQTKTETVPMKFVTGAQRVVNGSAYQLLSPTALTVSLIKGRNAKSITVPATVKMDGRTCKVVQIDSRALTGSKIRTVTVGKNVKTMKVRAFAGSKATTVVLKTSLLKKASVKGSFKSSKVKTVSVKPGSKAKNKKVRTKYKKFFTKAVLGRKVKLE